MIEAIKIEKKKPLYTTNEIANILNCSITSIVIWMKEDKLKGFKTPGGHRRVTHRNLVAFCEKYYKEGE